MKESELPQLRCGLCDEILGIMGLHEDDAGQFVYVMPCTKCHDLKEVKDNNERIENRI